mgnify:CR=1 FL=1
MMEKTNKIMTIFATGMIYMLAVFFFAVVAVVLVLQENEQENKANSVAKYSYDFIVLGISDDENAIFVTELDFPSTTFKVPLTNQNKEDFVTGQEYNISFNRAYFDKELKMTVLYAPSNFIFLKEETDVIIPQKLYNVINKD